MSKSRVGRVLARCPLCKGEATVREDGIPPAIKHQPGCRNGDRWCPTEQIDDTGDDDAVTDPDLDRWAAARLDAGDDPDQLAEAAAERPCHVAGVSPWDTATRKYRCGHSVDAVRQGLGLPDEPWSTIAEVDWSERRK